MPTAVAMLSSNWIDPRVLKSSWTFTVSGPGQVESIPRLELKSVQVAGLPTGGSLAFCASNLFPSGPFGGVRASTTSPWTSLIDADGFALIENTAQYIMPVAHGIPSGSSVEVSMISFKPLRKPEFSAENIIFHYLANAHDAEAVIGNDWVQSTKWGVDIHNVMKEYEAPTPPVSYTGGVPYMMMHNVGVMTQTNNDLSGASVGTLLPSASGSLPTYWVFTGGDDLSTFSTKNIDLDELDTDLRTVKLSIELANTSGVTRTFKMRIGNAEGPGAGNPYIFQMFVRNHDAVSVNDFGIEVEEVGVASTTESITQGAKTELTEVIAKRTFTGSGNCRNYFYIVLDNGETFSSDVTIRHPQGSAGFDAGPLPYVSCDGIEVTAAADTAVAITIPDVEGKSLAIFMDLVFKDDRGTVRNIAAVSDGTNNNYASLYLNNPDQLTALQINGGVGESQNALAVTFGDRYKILMIWDSGRQELWKNGVKTGPDARAFLPPSMTKLSINRRHNDDASTNDLLDLHELWISSGKVPTEAQATALTTV